MKREAIIRSAPQRAVVEFEIHGEPWHFLTMDDTQRAQFHMWQRPNGEYNEVRHAAGNAKLIAMTVCDEAGELQFTDADITWLRAQQSWWLAPIIEKALAAAGIDQGNMIADAIKKKSDSSKAATGDTST